MEKVSSWALATIRVLLKRVEVLDAFQKEQVDDVKPHSFVWNPLAEPFGPVAEAEKRGAEAQHEMQHQNDDCGSNVREQDEDTKMHVEENHNVNLDDEEVEVKSDLNVHAPEYDDRECDECTVCGQSCVPGEALCFACEAKLASSEHIHTNYDVKIPDGHGDVSSEANNENQSTQISFPLTEHPDIDDKVADSGSLNAGVMIWLVGLRSSPSLNGLPGEILNFDRAKCRYVVRVFDLSSDRMKDMLVKEENIRIMREEELEKFQTQFQQTS